MQTEEASMMRRFQGYEEQWFVILARLNEKTGPKNILSIAFLLNRTNIPLNRSPLPLIATMLAL